MDAQRQGRGRHGLLDRKPDLVHRLGRRAERGLFPNHRPAADSRPPVSRDRRRNLLPRRPSRPGNVNRVPGRDRARRANRELRPRRALPRDHGHHHRPPSALSPARYAAGRRPRPAATAAAVRAALASSERWRMGQQRQRCAHGGVRVSDRAQGQHLAGDGRERAVRAALVRIRRPDGRMAGPEPEFRAGLAVRFRARRQRRADGGD